MADLATADDLAAYWREPSESEKPRATAMLGYASAIVRAHCGGEPADADAARFVACDMVKTAMQAGGDAAPVTQLTMTGGPYSRTMQFANPTGDLYWKSQYDAVLGLSGTAVGCMHARTALDG